MKLGVIHSKLSTAKITLSNSIFLFIRHQEPRGTERFPIASSTSQLLLWFRRERLFLKPSLASRDAEPHRSILPSEGTQLSRCRWLVSWFEVSLLISILSQCVFQPRPFAHQDYPELKQLKR